MCKVLENRAQQDEERMDQLTNQLKEARLLAEDADGKSDEVRLESSHYIYIRPLFLIYLTSLGVRERKIYKHIRIPFTTSCCPIISCIIRTET